MSWLRKSTPEKEAYNARLETDENLRFWHVLKGYAWALLGVTPIVASSYLNGELSKVGVEVCQCLTPATILFEALLLIRAVGRGIMYRNPDPPRKRWIKL